MSHRSSICAGRLFLVVGAIACTRAPEAPSPPGAAPLLPTSHALAFRSSVRVIYQDRRGRYWFGSDQEGVARLDDTGLVYFTQTDGLPGNQIRAIQESPDGAIWLDTGNGIGRIDDTGVCAFPLEADPPVPAAPPSEAGGLWFGAGFHPGLQRQSGTTVQYLPLPTGPSADAPGVSAIALGKDDRVWIAAYGALFRHDPDSGFQPVVDLTPTAQRAGGQLHIRSILEDGDGTLWVGNNGLGVLRYDGRTTTDFSLDMGLVASGSARDGGPSPAGTLEHVFAIEQDPAGNLWFGDRDTGVWRYDGQAMAHYGLDEGLPSRSVWDIHVDRSGMVLVGLEGGEVRRLVDGRFEGVFSVRVERP